eukprot:m.311293 g.311293  ORF g.311293 m.311293 type:complete len:216 (+) comp64428_c0_seq1:14-661(+)
MELVQQGAEARLYSTTFQGRSCIVKERFSKSYRHEVLDAKLRQRRTTQEVRSLLRCRKAGIRTPTVYFVDLESYKIYMQMLDNCTTLRDFINGCKRPEEDAILRDVSIAVGQLISKMHNNDVIHGDLTTSNVMIHSESKDLFLLDFGLSSISSLSEDKGVDVYVLERALLSSHPNTEDLFQLILSAYKKTVDKSREIIAKLDEVRLRGRKRTMVG